VRIKHQKSKLTPSYLKPLKLFIKTRPMIYAAGILLCSFLHSLHDVLPATCALQRTAKPSFYERTVPYHCKQFSDLKLE